MDACKPRDQGSEQGKGKGMMGQKPRGHISSAHERVFIGGFFRSPGFALLKGGGEVLGELFFCCSLERNVVF